MHDNVTYQTRGGYMKIYGVYEEQPTQGTYCHGLFSDEKLAEVIKDKYQKDTTMLVYVDELFLNEEIVGDGSTILHKE